MIDERTEKIEEFMNSSEIRKVSSYTNFLFTKYMYNIIVNVAGNKIIF